MAVMENFLKWRDDNSLLATIIESGMLWAIGDSLSQTLHRPKQTFCPVRLLRHGAFGAFVYATLASLWYSGLEKMLPGNDIWMVVAKVVLDQMVWTPPFLSLMFIWTSLWQGKTLIEGFKVVRSELWNTLRVNWVVWPCIQAVNMGLVPVNYRIILINLINIPWTAFLSMSSNRIHKQELEKVPRDTLEV